MSTGRPGPPAGGDDRPRATDLEAAGLYDPDAADAANRLELLEYLLGQGIGLDELVRAHVEGRLVAAAADARLRKGQRQISADEVAALGGVDRTTMVTAWRSLGFPEPPSDARLWWPSDGETFASFALAAELFGAERAEQFSRVLGRAAAQLAEAAIAMFMTNVQAPLEQGNRPPVELARANTEAQVAADVIPLVFEAAFRHHVVQSLRRMDATTFTEGRERVVLCVGFADLVGSTELLHQLDPVATGRLAADFEHAATDLVARWSGRLVKVIGDGILFTATSTGHALGAAHDLVTWADLDDRLSGLRVGLTSGPVVWQDGDVHGPVVSLAARLCAAAANSQVLVDAGFAAAHSAEAGAAPALVPAGSLTLRGFAEPVDTFTIGGGVDS